MPVPEHLRRFTWPKRYAYCVEQCARVRVPELLVALSATDRKTLPTWRPPAYPFLLLVRSARGVRKTYWYLLCPRCQSRREGLYRPPRSAPDAWACIECHRLTWASTRYARGHPMRRRRVRIQQRREVMQRATLRWVRVPRAMAPPSNVPERRSDGRVYVETIAATRYVVVERDGVEVSRTSLD